MKGQNDKKILNYQPGEIEPKWQKEWEEKKIFSPDLDRAKKPWYNLMMFPYPSAEGLHVGNMYAFTGADVYGRFKRMQGHDVFEPIGLDGFGIHSENYALKIGAHPMDQAEKSEKNFYRQMHATGNAHDWTRTVETYNPGYYKWTQWLFVEMFKAGLAYRKKADVNWCPSCKTVLADEQVISGVCERCLTPVEKRKLEQWFFRITKYADRLLANIAKLAWTEKVKIAQRDWIGKKEGITIRYDVEGRREKIDVFTTRPDTNFGATFIALAPEHPLATKLATESNREEVERYIKETQKKSDLERQVEAREKTGVFIGSYAINQLTGYKMPIWISDFVLGEFGTGALVGVPGHDKRDFEFAKKFGLPVVRVVVGGDGDTSPITKIEQVQEEEGVMVNSEFLNGLDIHKAIDKIMDYMEEKGYGKREITYHLRDWLISRQRYWGAPIPMIYCRSCAEEGKTYFGNKEVGWNARGWFPGEEADLPLLLPRIEDYKPLGTGSAPLASHEEFYNTTCPNCGGPARRETDVSDTFLDSAWYFFRYTSTERDDVPFDEARVKKWLPVAIYIGGAEHSVLHLLYSRFVTMFLHDAGFIPFEEPYARFFAHGLLIKESAKMSKSRGNVVIPDEYIKKYGADTVRMYLMFLGPFSQGGDFRDSGIEGMSRFLKRVWTLFQRVELTDEENSEVLRLLHKTIRDVTRDLEELSYNTAIAKLMEFYNGISHRTSLSRQTALDFLKLLVPFAPHMTEELYHTLSLGSKDFIQLESWPRFREELLVEDEVTVVVQVNGKRRGELKVQSEKLKVQSEIEKEAKKQIEKYLDGKKIKKVVYVSGKIVNFVV